MTFLGEGSVHEPRRACGSQSACGPAYHNTVASLTPLCRAPTHFMHLQALLPPVDYQWEQEAFNLVSSSLPGIENSLEVMLGQGHDLCFSMQIMPAWTMGTGSQEPLRMKLLPYKSFMNLGKLDWPLVEHLPAQACEYA